MKPNTPKIAYLLHWNAASPLLLCEVYSVRLLNRREFKESSLLDLGRLSRSSAMQTMNPDDRAIFMRLFLLMPGTIRQNHWEVALSGSDGFTVLKMMIDSRRAFFKKSHMGRIKWAGNRSGRTAWEMENNGDWKPCMAVDPSGSGIFPTQPPTFADTVENSMGPVTCAAGAEVASKWIEAEAMAEARARAFCQRLMNRYPEASLPLPGSLAILEERDFVPVACLEIVRNGNYRHQGRNTPDDLHDLARLKLQFAYGRRRIAWDSDIPSISYGEGKTIRRIFRHKAAEEKVIETLLALGFEWDEQQNPFEFFNFHSTDLKLSRNSPHSWHDVIDELIPQWRREGWKVSSDEALKLVSTRETEWFVDADQTGENWFSFSAGIRYKKTKIPLLTIISDFLREHREKPYGDLVTMLKRASFAIPADDSENPEMLLLPGKKLIGIMECLFELFQDKVMEKEDHLVIDRWRVAALKAEIIEEDASADEIVEKVNHLISSQDGKAVNILEKADAPESLNASLRHYQQTGLGWLNFLRRHELNGILADDMGLGKTVQVLSLFLSEKNKGSLDGPTLIVTPTSVLENWISEMERFAPALSGSIYAGAQRHGQFNAIIKHNDLVITSYGTALRDCEKLASVPWDTIVLDESQFIKNANSQTARALFSLKAAHKLCLTGTPVQNHLGELWSQFHFLMPGFLGPGRQFRRHFKILTDRPDTQLAANMRQLLGRRIAPFILQRKKEAVLDELPPKTEILHIVSLTARQAELYEAVRLSLSKRINEELENRSIREVQIHILAALLKLRQICCDPRLLKKKKESLLPRHSSKLTAVLELVDSLLENGHRILLFSQFTSMLKLIEQEITAKNLSYLKLTGATRNRAELVERFQKGEAPLFLISLRAGGTGLNLTAADVVINYDPWWNPAVEQQAADRIHRIGQDKPVFVYNVICEDTVEAKIRKLQARKQSLIKDVLGHLSPDKMQFDLEAINYLLAE